MIFRDFSFIGPYTLGNELSGIFWAFLWYFNGILLGYPSLLSTFADIYGFIRDFGGFFGYSAL